MNHLSAGGKEVWTRYVAPPFSSAWRWARDLILMRRRRDAARSDLAVKASARRRHMQSWQRSHER